MSIVLFEKIKIIMNDSLVIPNLIRTLPGYNNDMFLIPESQN